MKIRLSITNNNGQSISYMFDIIADSMASYGDVGIYFDNLQNKEKLIKFLNKHKLEYQNYGTIYITPTPRVIIECADTMSSIAKIKAAWKKNEEADKLGDTLYFKYQELGVADKFIDLCIKYKNLGLHRYDAYLKAQEELKRDMASVIKK